MHRRDLASLVALSTLALTVGVGCPEDPKPTPPKHVPRQRPAHDEEAAPKSLPRLPTPPPTDDAP